MTPGAAPRFSHVELVGDRVRLRPVSPNDAPVAFELLSDDRVTRTLLWDGPASLEELEGSYRAMSNLPLGEPPRYPLAIERVGLPGVAGGVGPRTRLHPKQFDIGYWLGAPYWNRA